MVIRLNSRKKIRSVNKGDADQLPQPPVPTLNVEVTTPLKYLSNFWRSLDLLLINCEIGLDLSWTKECVLIEQYNRCKFCEYSH